MKLVAVKDLIGVQNTLIVVSVFVSFHRLAVFADSGNPTKSCHNTGSQKFCHRNKFDCGSPAVRWNCQRKCRVRMPGIINDGDETASSTHPWHVSLIAPGKKSPFCAGTLISDVHVLTAAHCIDGKNHKEVLAVIGDDKWTPTSTENTYAVKCIQNHYSYDSALMDHDISLLTLQEKVHFGINKQPACLPRTTNFKDRGMKQHQFTASGWGSKLSEEGHPISLNSVDLDYVTWRRCRKMYNKDSRKISWRTFCSSPVKREDVSTCVADGGGGFVKKDDPTGRVTVMGIASWGLGCDENRASGVYTDVRMQMDWISKKIADQTC